MPPSIAKGFAGGVIASLLFAWSSIVGATPVTQGPISLVWEQQAPLPGFKGGPATTLNSVSCSGKVCVAVGYLDDGISTSAIVATNASGIWVMSDITDTLGGTDAQLNSVSCLPSGCTAVGTFNNGTATQAFVASNFPSGWTETPVPTTLPNATDVFLQSISCVTTGCTGAGYYSDGTSPHAFSLTSPAFTWVETPIARVSGGADGDQLSSVSCTDSNCTAVGTLTFTDPTTFAVTTQAFWTSSSNAWVEEPISTVTPELSAGLNAVSCTATSCTAVGGANQQNAIDTQAIVASDASGSWVETPVVNPVSDSVNTTLSDIFCSDAVCNAGGSSTLATHVIPFSLSDASGAWVASSPPLDVAQTDGGFNGITCTSATNCLAVGSAVNSGISVELIELSAQALQFTDVPDARAQVGVPYASQVTATGGVGATTYSVSSGQLPDGVVLNTVTGQLVGTPTSPGVSTFTMTATNIGPPAQSISTSSSISTAAATLTISVAKGSLTLAATGFDFAPLVVGAVLLTVAGAVVLCARRESKGTL